MKILVAGGGYAGMSCLMELARRLPDSQRVLIDPARDHLKLTRLHEALQHGIDRYRLPFAGLAGRYGFEHRRARPRLGLQTLVRASERGRLALPGGEVEFDVLVVAVGARPRPRPGKSGWLGLADLKHRDGRRLIRQLSDLPARSRVTVVGGGATGLQYLFELNDALRRAGGRCRLRLVDGGERLLPGLPGTFHQYLVRRMAQSDIEYLAETRLLEAETGGMRVTTPTGRGRHLASARSLVFAGLRGNPVMLDTNVAGQVLVGGVPLPNVFAAGDCSLYAGRGFNAASAQAAVRKGRHVAEAIQRLAEGRPLPVYGARELGFFLSMGTLDGIGWMGLRRGIVTGLPAFAVREAIEARYELFLAGLDTYQVL